MEYYCEKGGNTYREQKYSIPQYKSTHATDFFIQFFTFLISNMAYDCLVHRHSDILQWKLLPTKRQYLNKASNTPKLSPMDEGHEQPDSPEVSSRGTW